MIINPGMSEDKKDSVSSFNGRTGDVVPASGDYTVEQITRSAGRSMAGQTVEPVQGTTVTAGEGAEVFNDYQDRTFGADEGYSLVKPQLGNVASGNRAHAEGRATTASGANSHAEGYCTTASGSASHAEGGAFTGLEGSKATAYAAHAEGTSTVASGKHSHAEGSSTTASGSSSHAEGSSTKAFYTGCHAEGINTTAGSDDNATQSDAACHAEGYYTVATGTHGSHAEGDHTTASDMSAHAEGDKTQATGSSSHAEGSSTISSGSSSHAEGYNTKATAMGSHAEGISTTSSGQNSHAEGYGAIASGHSAHAEGYYTKASASAQHAGGRCNVEYTSESSKFIIGKGSSENSRANCFRVTDTGVYATGAHNTSGADYAELFEWLDGNPEGADRCGRFVTLDGEKIRLAGPGDDFILGIVSGNPSVVGDVHDDQWQGMYLYDVFGRPLWEDVEVPDETIDEPDPEDPEKTVTRIIIPAHMEHRQKLNPAYDGSQPYQPRTQRPEWDAVGMLGKLVAVDDGTCQVNGWCTVGEGGAATYSAARTRYRVMARLDECHIRVLIL